MNICKYCINEESCEKCDKGGWYDKFIPSEGVMKYFRESYNSVRGMHGFTYDFDTTNDSLVPTHHIMIGNDYFCPYCGEIMYPIQDAETLITTGHCCICEGARTELEYEERKKDLDNEYRQKVRSLQEEYSEKLSFCSEKLFEIKQKRDKDRFDFFSHDYNHFSTLNGEKYNKIQQITE